MSEEETNISRIRVRITREGWIYLIILAFVSAGALLRNINLLMLMTGIMIAPLFLSWRICLAMLRNLLVVRTIPNQLFVGKPSIISWCVTNRRRSIPTWQLVVQDHIATLDEPRRNWNRVRVVIPQIKPTEVSYGTYKSNFLQRGVYIAGPARISTRFPCGMIEAYFFAVDRTKLLVAPATGRLTASWDRRLISHASGSQARKRQRGSQDEEFVSLRHWRNGDNRRHIHWRVTAKYNHPVVKQFDSRSDRDFVLALDLWSPDPTDESLAEPLEQALSFASTVLTGLPGVVKGKVAVAICGAQLTVLSDHCGPQLCAQIWNELAVADGSSAPDLMAGLEQLAEHVTGGTPFYIISTRNQPEHWLQLIQKGGLSPQFLGIEPWIRWLKVDTDEFRELFEPPSELSMLSPITTREGHDVHG
jgi:uncharacterized protein (DUF58 family)